VEEAGADALTIANTYPAMSVDIQTRKSRIGKATGGLSGPAIKPITLRLVNEVWKAVRIPVIGLGGIEKAEDVLEYFIAGAAAIQIGTASFTDPRTCENVVAELGKLCTRLSIMGISELTGTFSSENV
jgi:dihydroorotate dehydrogenase (NAD+) catalytic subunit